MLRYFFLLTAMLITTLGCAPSRAPIPPGEIPPGAFVTAEDERYGQEVLATLMRTYPLERDDYSINRVRDIVDQLALAAGAADSPWNTYVLRGDKVVNAAATRGHFVFVWTGMLRTVQNDQELAAVLAHEIGHVLADHTQPTPGEEAAEITASLTGEVTGRLVATQGAYGALGQIAGVLAEQAVKALVVNPESQRKELEADQIGIFLMADAQFDPREALSLWSKMAKSSDPQLTIPAFLSTHPANEDRLAQIELLLPAAQERYRTALSFPPRQGTKGRPQFEPDTFTVEEKRPPRERSTEWLAIEDGATIFTSPSTRSQPVRRLGRDEPVGVGRSVGPFYEVFSPVHGYVLSAEIYPTQP